MKKDKKETQKWHKHFNQGTYERSYFHAKPVPFSKLYVAKSVKLKYLLAALLGVVYAILTLFLAKNTGGFSYGLSSLLQGVSKLSSYFINQHVSEQMGKLIYSLMYWGLVFIANTSLLFFAWKKVGHRFTLLSLTWVVTSTVVGIGLDQIPHINEFCIFGNTQLINHLEPYTAPWISTLNNAKIQILPFAVSGELINTYDPANFAKPFLLILSTTAYALCWSFGFSILFIVGGSTAGTDVFSTYLSGTKKKDVSTFFLALNFICITFASLLGCYIPAALAAKECQSFYFFFNANWVATVISLVIFTFIYRKLYPQNKRCKVEIYSDKIEAIKKKLYDNNYAHGSSLSTRKSGRSEKVKGTMNTVCLAIELPLLVNLVDEVDDESMISVIKLDAYDGSFENIKAGTR